MEQDRDREREQEMTTVNVDRGRMLMGFPTFVATVSMVLSLGGSYWYVRGAVDRLREDMTTVQALVERERTERGKSAEQLAAMSAKLDYLIEEVRYIRQDQGRAARRTERGDQR